MSRSRMASHRLHLCGPLRFISPLSQHAGRAIGGTFVRTSILIRVAAGRTGACASVCELFGPDGKEGERSISTNTQTLVKAGQFHRRIADAFVFAAHDIRGERRDHGLSGRNSARASVD